jgi:enoyl-CoA hydratase/carnithine racemase
MIATLEPDEPILLRDDRNGVATLTMNRPAARNALSAALMSSLEDAFEAIAKDAGVKVVILAANGSAFCAGHDLKEIRANPERQNYEILFTQCSRLMVAITRLSRPVIAKVHATATAAGCQLIATCDLAVTSDNARFATPGVNIGLFCSTPMVALSRAIGRKPAMEMLLTGTAVDAAEALRLGLVNRVVAPDALDGATWDLAVAIAAKSSLTVATGKEAFYRQIELDLDAAYAYASKVMTSNMMAHDAAEGIDAFLEKRPPKWEGR